MSVNTGIANDCCRVVQQELINLAQENDTTYRIENPGTLAAVMAPRNNNGFEAVDIQDPTGKTRIVRLKYWTNPRTAASDADQQICTAGSTTGEKFASITIDKTSSVKLTFNDAEFRLFCASLAGASNVSSSGFAQSQIRAAMNQLVVKINNDTVDNLVANVGNFINGAAGPKTVTLLNTNFTPQYKGESTMMKDFEDIEAPGRPIITGSGIMRDYTTLKGIACCNDGGVDISRTTGSFDFYRDGYVDTSIGTSNNFIAWEPGAFRMFFRNFFVGPFDFTQEDKVKATMIFVWNGISIPLDMTLYYNFCGTDGTGKTSQWILTFAANYGYFYLPSDLEAAASPFFGVNNILHYVGDCGDVTCDPVS